jgi:hypothetical protein
MPLSSIPGGTEKVADIGGTGRLIVQVLDGDRTEQPLSELSGRLLMAEIGGRTGECGIEEQEAQQVAMAGRRTTDQSIQ